MKPSRMAAAVVPFLALSMLAGCWDMRELEHMFYAHAVGVDYEDGAYKLYVQIIDFSALGKQEGVAQHPQGTGGSWVGKGTGSSMQEALHDLYATSQRRIYWGHLNAIILSQSILELGTQESIGVLTRYNEFRYTSWLFATREPIEDVLLASPILEFTPVYSQLSDPADVFKQSSFIRPRRMFQLITEMNEEGRTPLLPIIRLSRGHWVDKQTRYSAIEMSGAVILKDGRWHSTMSRDELKGERWVEFQTSRAPLFIKDTDRTIAVLVVSRPICKVAYHMQGNRIRFDIRVKARAGIIEQDVGQTEEQLSGRAADLIRSEIRRTFEEGIKRKTDVLNLLDVVYRKDYPLFRRLKQEREFPLDSSSLHDIDVSVVITNTGKTSQSFRIQ